MMSLYGYCISSFFSRTSYSDESFYAILYRTRHQVIIYLWMQCIGYWYPLPGNSPNAERVATTSFESSPHSFEIMQLKMQHARRGDPVKSM